MRFYLSCLIFSVTVIVFFVSFFNFFNPVKKVSAGFPEPTQVTGCMLITEPGWYELASDIVYSAPLNIPNYGNFPTCIHIASPNVDFNGRNFTIRAAEGVEGQVFGVSTQNLVRNAPPYEYLFPFVETLRLYDVRLERLNLGLYTGNSNVFIEQLFLNNVTVDGRESSYVPTPLYRELNVIEVNKGSIYNLTIQGRPPDLTRDQDVSFYRTQNLYLSAIDSNVSDIVTENSTLRIVANNVDFSNLFHTGLAVATGNVRLFGMTISAVDSNFDNLSVERIYPDNVGLITHPYAAVQNQNYSAGILFHNLVRVNVREVYGKIDKENQHPFIGAGPMSLRFVGGTDVRIENVETEGGAGVYLGTHPNNLSMSTYYNNFVLSYLSIDAGNPESRGIKVDRRVVYNNLLFDEVDIKCYSTCVEVSAEGEAYAGVAGPATQPYGLVFKNVRIEYAEDENPPFNDFIMGPLHGLFPDRNIKIFGGNIESLWVYRHFATTHENENNEDYLVIYPDIANVWGTVEFTEPSSRLYGMNHESLFPPLSEMVSLDYNSVRITETFPRITDISKRITVNNLSTAGAPIILRNGELCTECVFESHIDDRVAFSVLTGGGEFSVQMNSITGEICAADYDESGEVNNLDLFRFLSDWFDGNADFDGNSQVNVNDIFAFIQIWFAGC
jgi:hypothetical protein